MATSPRRQRGRPRLYEREQRRRLIEAAWRVFEATREERVTGPTS